MPQTDHFDYVEFQSRDVAASQRFFEAVFGWVFTDYGDSYSSFSRDSAGIDGGFATGEPGEGALAVLYATDLKRTRDACLAAGAELVRDVFGFPGGERFEFREPGGNRMGVWSHIADPKDA